MVRWAREVVAVISSGNRSGERSKPPKKPSGGVVCRRCGSTAFRVADTYRILGGIRRRRVCEECGEQKHTTER